MEMIGLTEKQVVESREKNGNNELTQIPPDPLWRKILDGFKDPMIMILLVALCIQMILFFTGQAEWFEPVGILLAILIANGVASVSENRQEIKATLLKKEEESKEYVKAIRNGNLTLVHINDIVVGDIIYLQAGDKIPADGIIVEGALKVDQAALNGETEEAEKIVYTEDDTYDPKDLLNRYYIYRGTVVCGGEGYQKVLVTGDRTLFGELALEVQEETRITPLQLKLSVLAQNISKFGYIGAIAIIAGILIKTILMGESPLDLFGWIRLLIDAITVAVTIIVCAVPEGLPMLTSILLSFQSIKMAKDNVLVRKINGLETAGSLNILFSDKTGTITEGKLSLVELATGNIDRFSNFDQISSSLGENIVIGIGANNSASISNGSIIGGNSTDRALADYLKEMNVGHLIESVKILSRSAFDSAKKYSSITVLENGEEVTYIKGAPEKIITECTHYIDKNGKEQKIANSEVIDEYINQQAKRSMRILAVVKVVAERRVLICIASIRDNVREEAIKAIREVQNAGVQVVMVTGDRKETAIAIATEAGLLSSENDIALTSSDLAQKTDDELKQILPHLRVVSRALPTDKSRLVKVAQELDYVVGMTGDGVNDSPALKKADVGFAMGSGTEVAKEAGDITILDDNFISIEKAILYGRTMFKSIRKFLIFQLTVNVAAVLTCFIGPLLGENVILTVIQLLLINLAMDTLAAIAFGSEPALKEYMKEDPVPRSEGIVSKDMLIEVIISAIYITIICLSILYVPAIRQLFGDVDSTYLKSALFATFMMAITFNGFNARTNHINPFENIGRNKNFILVMLSIFVLQFVFVTFGGDVLSVERLTPESWLICFTLAFMIIPIDVSRKMILNRRFSKDSEKNTEEREVSLLS